MSMQSSDGTLTVYSDYICPFCYLGRAALEAYQATRETPVRIDWRPFDLRARKRKPDGSIDHAVDDGKDEAYYEQSRRNVRRLRDEYDVEMAIDHATDVDSLPAQRASYSVKQDAPYEEWLAFDAAIYDALWLDERDIGDAEVLVSLADEVGIPEEVIRSALADDELAAAVDDQLDAARQAGISGVPTFIYDGYVARGAVPPDHFRRLVETP